MPGWKETVLARSLLTAWDMLTDGGATPGQQVRQEARLPAGFIAGKRGLH
jgi:hypothetical protein